jgi:hypothetical protein
VKDLSRSLPWVVEEDPSKHLPWAVAVFPEGVLVAVSQEEVVAGVIAEQSSEISIHSGTSDIQERASLSPLFFLPFFYIDV